MKEKLYKVVGNNQKNPFVGDGTICNCLPAAMGMGGDIYLTYFLNLQMMKKITEKVAKTLLAGCYKFGSATLLRKGGATMTYVVEVYEKGNSNSK